MADEVIATLKAEIISEGAKKAQDDVKKVQQTYAGVGDQVDKTSKQGEKDQTRWAAAVGGLGIAVGSLAIGLALGGQIATGTFGDLISAVGDVTDSIFIASGAMDEMDEATDAIDRFSERADSAGFKAAIDNFLTLGALGIVNIGASLLGVEFITKEDVEEATGKKFWEISALDIPRIMVNAFINLATDIKAELDSLALNIGIRAIRLKAFLVGPFNDALEDIKRIVDDIIAKVKTIPVVGEVLETAGAALPSPSGGQVLGAAVGTVNPILGGIIKLADIIGGFIGGDGEVTNIPGGSPHFVSPPLSETTKSGLGGGGPQEIRVVVNLDGRKIAESMSRHETRIGRRFQGATL